MNGKFEGSRVDDMNDLKMVSSNIAKSCICTRFRDVGREKKPFSSTRLPSAAAARLVQAIERLATGTSDESGAMMGTMTSRRALLMLCYSAGNGSTYLNPLNSKGKLLRQSSLRAARVLE